MNNAGAVTDYGRLGRTSYDQDSQTWQFIRDTGVDRGLEFLGTPRTHIESNLNRASLEAGEPIQRSTRSRLARRLDSNFAGAEAVILKFDSDEPFQERRFDAPRNAQQLAAHGILTGRKSRNVPIVAFASGHQGQILSVARGRPGIEGWQDDYDSGISTVHFDRSRSSDFDNQSGPVLQISLSKHKSRHRVLVAVRYATQIVILEASLSDPYQRQFAAPEAVYLRRVYSHSDFATRAEDVTCFCFSRNVPEQLFTGHLDGSLQVWQLPSSRHETIKLRRFIDGDKDAQPRSVSCVTSMLDGTLIVASGCVIRIYASSGTEPAVLILSGEVFTARLILREHILVVLTAQEVVWIYCWPMSGNDERRYEMAYTHAHHRDAQSGPLDLAEVPTQDEEPSDPEQQPIQKAALALYARHDALIEIYQAQVLLDATDDRLAGLKVLDPLIVRPASDTSSVKTAMQSAPLHLEFCRAPYWIQSSVPGESMASLYHDEGYSFLQGFIHAHDRSLQSFICFRPPHNVEPREELRPLAWSRTLGRQIPLSSRFASAPFIVHDVEDEAAPEKSTTETDRRPWYQQARVAKLELQQSELRRFMHHRSLNVDAATVMLSQTFSLRAKLGSLAERPRDSSSFTSATARQLSELATFEGVPRDHLQDSDYLQQLESELAVCRMKQGRAGLSEIAPALEVATRKRARKGPSASVQQLYASRKGDGLAHVPNSETAKRQSAFEQVVQSFASSSRLAGLIFQGQGGAALESSQSLKAETIAANLTDLQDDSAPLQAYLPVNIHGSDDRRRSHAGTARLLANWMPGNEEAEAATLSEIDMSRYDTAASGPRTEEQLAESQRQQRRLEKQQRRFDEASQPSAPSSQLPSTQTQLGLPPQASPSAQFSTRDWFQNSQPTFRPAGQKSTKMQRPGFQSSQGAGSLMLTAPANTRFSSQDFANTGPLTQTQLASPPLTQSQGQSQVNWGSQGIVSSSKRLGQDIMSSQASVGLPMRKKRKAGF